jgi:hypothetical protein
MDSGLFDIFHSGGHTFHLEMFDKTVGEMVDHKMVDHKMVDHKMVDMMGVVAAVVVVEMVEAVVVVEVVVLVDTLLELIHYTAADWFL